MDTITIQRAHRWTDNPHQTVPLELAAALRDRRRVRGGPLGAVLAACRAAGWGVPALAAATGMTCTAVAQQIVRARRAGNVDAGGLAIPVPELTAEQHPARGGGRGWPSPPLPPGAAEHLRALHEVASQVRCNMSASHPCRVASAHLAEDINLLLGGSYRKARIAAALQVTYRSVDYLLERHGYRPPVASISETWSGYVRPKGVS